jgi:hypothetical protein
MSGMTDHSESMRRFLRACNLPDARASAFAALDDRQLAHAAQLVEDARARERSAMDQAIRDALQHIPALLRKPVVRILGG